MGRYCFSSVCPDEPQPHSSKYHKQMFQAFVAHDCCRREGSERDPAGSPFNLLCSPLDHWARSPRRLALLDSSGMRCVCWTLVSLLRVMHKQPLQTELADEQRGPKSKCFFRKPFVFVFVFFGLFHFSSNCLKPCLKQTFLAGENREIDSLFLPGSISVGIMTAVQEVQYINSAFQNLKVLLDVAFVVK